MVSKAGTLPPKGSSGYAEIETVSFSVNILQTARQSIQIFMFNKCTDSAKQLIKTKFFQRYETNKKKMSFKRLFRKFFCILYISQTWLNQISTFKNCSGAIWEVFFQYWLGLKNLVELILRVKTKIFLLQKHQKPFGRWETLANNNEHSIDSIT